MKNLDYCFNSISLYVKEEFSIFNYTGGKYVINNEEYRLFLDYIGANQSKIISYCHCCKKEFPFNIDKKLFNFSKNYKNNQLYMSVVLSDESIIKFHLDGDILGALGPYDEDILKLSQIWYIEYFFECANDQNHLYIMIISIELKNGKLIVRKVGQNPSMLTIKGFDFDSYRKYLEKIDAYSDYKKADLSNAEKFHVGAYAYLRRVFEKMINDYLGDSKLSDNRMDTKIEAVKENFDTRVRDLLKNLYGILSKGIHELDEQESGKYYTFLKAIIDIQLEYIKTENEKDLQSKELSGVLGKIARIS